MKNTPMTAELAIAVRENFTNSCEWSDTLSVLSVCRKDFTAEEMGLLANALAAYDAYIEMAKVQKELVEALKELIISADYYKDAEEKYKSEMLDRYILAEDRAREVIKKVRIYD